MIGTVKHWNTQRGYGFIAPDDEAQDVFVHVSALPNGVRALDRDQRVEFSVKPGNRGKGEQAASVRLV